MKKKESFPVVEPYSREGVAYNKVKSFPFVKYSSQYNLHVGN